MTKPWNVGKNSGDATPIKIFGNLYFVGTQPASTHIIDTGDGLIMLDSGYRETLHLVLHHMWLLGLEVKDLKYIVHTHGHIDHIGATAELVRISGAKTFLGVEDRDYANGKLDLTYAKEYNMTFDGTFEPDVLIKDGDIIELGNTKIRCIATPGHTPGCMSFFFDVSDGNNTYKAALHGGMGINTMSKEYLDKYGLDYNLREKFLNAMDKLAEEQVDIFLGNHMQHNNTVLKTEQVLGGNNLAFVNPNEWKPYCLWCKENLMNIIEKENSVRKE